MGNKLDIYPSVLESDTQALARRLKEYSAFFPHMQIDIADGVFVENKTVQIDKILKMITSQPPGIPFGNPWGSGIPTFEFHLMVKNWISYLEKLKKLCNYMQITRVLVHAQVFNSQFSILNSQFELGLVLNPEDSVSDYLRLITKFQTVQLMTVHPGKQGSAFLPEVLDKIDELRDSGFAGEIILDGAMNELTLPRVLARKHWPDAVCPGSYFHKRTQEKLHTLQKIANP
ncbi:MAG: hypothetical protein ACE5DQ_01455 [Candidatus Paceibacterota bacterium]